MNENLKRALFIFAFLVVVIGAGFGLYILFFKGESPILRPPTSTSTTPGQLPTSGPGGVSTTGTGTGGTGVLPTTPGQPFNPSLPTGVPTQQRSTVLRSDVSRNIAMSNSGALRGYDPLSGKFYRVNADGSVTDLSSQTFYGVDQVAWGNNSDKAVLSYPDGNNVLYDFQTQKQVTLPKHWDDFDFSPQDDAIAAKSLGINEDNRFLIISNPDGTNSQPIQELGNNADKVHVSWSPNDQIVAYSFTGNPLGFDRQQVLLLGKNQENFRGLDVEGRGFIPNWSPSGNNLLYSAYQSGSGYLPSLWVSGAVGDDIGTNRRELQLNTWADKCTWRNESEIICGVPTSLGTGAGLQRSLFANTPDQLVRVNVDTGETVVYGSPSVNDVAIQQMVATPDGSAVIFTDTISGQLIRFEL
ncbi:MAG: hypothetical protein KC582_02855 [Candidatus Magasanikbacteria bacterium]|nr:hypothetical protein [Candidatus Magasanikbacteria bacterium]MCA9391169.1 hypothetical protein [Candidatus Magasanikbacteria bacterium]